MCDDAGRHSRRAPGWHCMNVTSAQMLSGSMCVRVCVCVCVCVWACGEVLYYSKWLAQSQLSQCSFEASAGSLCKSQVQCWVRNAYCISMKIETGPKDTSWNKGALNILMSAMTWHFIASLIIRMDRFTSFLQPASKLLTRDVWMKRVYWFVRSTQARVCTQPKIICEARNSTLWTECTWHVLCDHLNHQLIASCQFQSAPPKVNFHSYHINKFSLSTS